MGLSVTLIKPYWETDDMETFVRRDRELYKADITHNLAEMAKACGLYDVLWRPYRLRRSKFKNEQEEREYEINTEIFARELIPDIEKGLEELMNDRDYYKCYNADNGWGIYENLVAFTKNYLDACRTHPYAIVRVDR